MLEPGQGLHAINVASFFPVPQASFRAEEAQAFSFGSKGNGRLQRGLGVLTSVIEASDRGGLQCRAGPCRMTRPCLASTALPITEKF
jgi:hypothetical protein